MEESKYLINRDYIRRYDPNNIPDLLIILALVTGVIGGLDLAAWYHLTGEMNQAGLQILLATSAGLAFINIFIEKLPNQTLKKITLVILVSVILITLFLYWIDSVQLMIINIQLLFTVSFLFIRHSTDIHYNNMKNGGDLRYWNSKYKVTVASGVIIATPITIFLGSVNTMALVTFSSCSVLLLYLIGLHVLNKAEER